MEWERVAPDTERLKVHNGWLVHRLHKQYQSFSSGYRSRSQFQGVTGSMVFVIDQAHLWQLDARQRNNPVKA